jgi:hypothetical protein
VKAENWKLIIEVLGVASIVASLVFVGMELRQSSALARMEARQNYLTPLSESFRELAMNSEYSDLALNMFDSDRELSDISRTEFARIQSFYSSYLALAYGVYSAVQDDILDETDLALVSDSSGAYNTDVFRFLWFERNLGRAYAEDFRIYFETLSWNSEQ